jgi:hypothetical protein
VFIDEVEDFLRSSFWTRNVEILKRPDVSFHEAVVSTSVHPILLEYIFGRFLQGIGREICNVGHAVVGEQAYIKYYTKERPVFNLVWRHAAGVTLCGDAESPFSTWTDAGESAFLRGHAFRGSTPEDETVIDNYFGSEHWREMLAKCADPRIEHFHIYLLSDLDPRYLGPRFADALRQAGYDLSVPVYYLARPDISAMWIGLVTDGRVSLEVCCYYTPETAFEIKEMTEAERSYGGDGWTCDDLRKFIRHGDYQTYTLREADEAVQRAVALAGNGHNAGTSEG